MIIETNCFFADMDVSNSSGFILRVWENPHLISWTQQSSGGHYQGDLLWGNQLFKFSVLDQVLIDWSDSYFVNMAGSDICRKCFSSIHDKTTRLQIQKWNVSLCQVSKYIEFRMVNNHLLKCVSLERTLTGLLKVFLSVTGTRFPSLLHQEISTWVSTYERWETGLLNLDRDLPRSARLRLQNQARIV